MEEFREQLVKQHQFLKLEELEELARGYNLLPVDANYLRF